MKSANARQVRRAIRRQSHRKRRQLMFVSGGALVAAVTTAMSIASLSGIDVAAAAAQKARSIADLLAQRSPGERTAAILTKTKHKYSAVLAEREVPEAAPALPPLLAEALLPTQPVPELPALAQAGPPIPPIFLPGGGVIFIPPGGGGGGPGPPPPSPPPPPPPPPPPLSMPEPGTWAMMIVGFGIAGMQLRRDRGAKPGIFPREECASP